MDGAPPSHHSVVAAEEVGLDIRDIRSRGLTRDMVANSDYVVGMTHGHVAAICAMFPEFSDRVYRLSEFAGPEKGLDGDVADPIGGSLEIYRLCRDEIKSGVFAMLEKLGNEASASTVVAIGSDHAGFELKQALLAELSKGGTEVLDFGTDSVDSVDYPDFAAKVSEAVRDGDARWGILVCSSGIGMSIRANKTAGVRAALVYNAEAAMLSRSHNDANVLCLGQRFISPEEAVNAMKVFLSTEFEGGRHARRVGKIGAADESSIESVDPDVARYITAEKRRQQEGIELIASENFTSPAVMEAQGSTLTNKYAEGYPSKRWYGGCENVDEIEALAIERAKTLFGAEHANVQPHSGSGANMAVYFATLNPGDKILTMDLSHGGHLTHGNRANFSGRFFDVVHYGVSQEDERIDYDQLERMAHEEKPQMITVGASAYSRIIDFERMGRIARDVGALLLADIAHIAGLVAAGVHPTPIGHAHFVTTTTHKTLRGPRGGLILCSQEDAKRIDSQVFPGIQGGPLEHVIAAKAVCFQEALSEGFRDYQRQVVANANALAEGMIRNGYRIVSGGTENHCFLVDVGAKDLTGKACQEALDEAAITVNKNTIPFETRSPFTASGIRLGSPAVTTRGMKEPEMAAIADMISETLMDLGDADKRRQTRERVCELTARFPLPY